MTIGMTLNLILWIPHGDFSHATSYGVNVSLLLVIRFARASSQISGLNNRHKTLTATAYFLSKGTIIINCVNIVSKFYRRQSKLMSKHNVALKTLLLVGQSESEFYRNFVYKFRKIVGKTDFLEQLKKMVTLYK